MKQYVSVFMVMLQSIQKKLILILTAMTVVECMLFALSAGSSLWMEQVIDASHLQWIAALAFAALTAVLIFGRGAGRQEYTLLRLSLTDRQVFHCRALCFALCYLLLWALQLFLALVFCKTFTAIHSEVPGIGEQTAFLAFYRHPFLHSLLPMAELTRWMRNLMLLTVLSLSAANAARKPSGSISWSTLILTALTIAVFSFPMGALISDWLISFFSLTILCCISLDNNWKKDTDREVPLDEMLQNMNGFVQEVESCEEV